MRISDWSSDVCSSDLAAEAHTLLLALDRIELLQALQALLLGELGLEHPHGLRSVLELRPRHLARHDDARREVREAERRRRLVDGRWERATVRTPVTNEHISCRPLLEQKQQPR